MSESTNEQVTPEVTDTPTPEVTDTPTYTPEQFGEVRKARHAVRDALAKFFKVVEIATDSDTTAVTRLSHRSYSAMRGIAGMEQEAQVQRFDWVKENVEAALAALAEVESTDEVDAKALALATAVATERVLPLVAEGRNIAAERDFASYLTAKQAYLASQRGYSGGYSYRGSRY